MNEPIRLGLLRLCDAAPVILAKHEGLFAEAGLEVALSIEPSWANIADKLVYNMLDGAVVLPPLAMACAAGLRGRKVALAVPMSLSAEGNSVTLSVACQEIFNQHGMAGLVARKRLRLAVVHGFSSHDLLLRHWLTTQGVQPDQDVEITVLPPAEMVGSLAAGAIDGFCVGAPWGLVANKAGMGFTACRSRDIWPGHPEKCLTLQADFVATAPERLHLMLQVLLRTQRECAAPESRAKLAALLERPEYLDLPADLLAEALDSEKGGPSFTAPYPSVTQAQWYARQMQRWSKAPAGLEGVTEQLYRPDLFLCAGGEWEKDVPPPLEVMYE
ncbi:CmpA/NrtA family ABC transporter substrate-binding protein [Acidocella aminolytica]|jgi:NitT/TauT family transport system ATP-binding protein/nitrate/nitrite transport system substrate-binding protein|uniref:Nitrate/nitrite transporter ATP-binding protein NtrA n=1 Tax=Acidocella aminolytica 101 = DSM 11237 TaxID=1120923 RepID=A0A0D6PGW8_9PROT|nr:CmpA/NrtA family ABC transporter substrate-binding protein [Acidocella aminolytica]GAN80089.1 nitrate/nitrite transporter ATP-binding protein NtrA [Acidocella aminolytica 101 = DSM 11237]GBQ43566.1 nitrate/sulfonate/bicarbonate ABC transporter substrate-binding periplasmic protein [Acidocella aminolytica 101 = DSM 11237]SHE68161.1 NitT/TauT family transport system ATP-binding protein [Acidocella aminolytica 101 = DSM 11237]